MSKKTLIIVLALVLLGGLGYWWWSKNKSIKPQLSDQIKIGALLPLTGDLAKYGESGKQGLIIALNEFKTNHKNLNCEIVIEDDKADVKVALSSLNKLITIDNVKIVVGAMASGVTLGIAPTINEKKIILIAPTSTASDVTNAGDYIFRVCVSDAFEGKSMANYIANNFKSKRIGVIYINNDYGVGLKKNFIESAKAENLNIVFENGYNPTQKDFRIIINKLKNEMVDLLYIVSQKEQIDFFSQCKEQNYKPQFTGSTMIEDNDLLNKLGDFLNGTLYTYRSYNSSDTGVTTKYFVDAYQKKFNTLPDFYAASVYDATKLALKTAFDCSTNNTDYKTYLYTLKNFNGVTGLITFDKNGDVQQGFSIKEIKSGNFFFKD
ncbi:MAG: ABC transporter substrate-binding protein [Chitinophagales bacterium]|nr:ABC transporter substrate-binding protein [Chitinophagales bacterium]